MQKVYTTTDFYIEVKVYDAEGTIIPLNQINFLEIEFYTHQRSNAAVFDKTDIDSSNNLCVPWQDLKKLPSGVIKYFYHVSYTDPNFPDGDYDYSNEIQTDAFLVNELPCDCHKHQFSDQYVTRLDLAKLGLIDSSTEEFMTEADVAEALEDYYTKYQVDQAIDRLHVDELAEEVQNLDSSLSDLKEEVDAIVIPDYTEQFNAIDASIAALDASVAAIVIPDYTDEFNAIDASLDALDASVAAIVIPDWL